PAVLKFYSTRTCTEWGVGSDAISALDWWAFGLPGLQGMHLPKGSIPRMGYTPAGYHDTGGSYHLHFPDGNASIARALVRDLMPHALPGSGIEDLVMARADYSQLDRSDNPVRVRLSSTAVHARNVSEATDRSAVELIYMRGGSAYRAHAKHAVLAG